jgi:ribosomal protein S27AE
MKKDLLKELYERREKVQKTLKPDCPFCGASNNHDNFLARHMPWSIYECGKCGEGFSLTFSPHSGEIKHIRKGIM